MPNESLFAMCGSGSQLVAADAAAQLLHSYFTVTSQLLHSYFMVNLSQGYDS